MKSSASIDVQSIDNGRRNFNRIYSEPPISFRETIDGVKIINTAAGPLGGDEYFIDINIEDGASLTLGSIASSIAQPGTPASKPSKISLKISLGRSSQLRWVPQSLILIKDSYLIQKVEIYCQPNSILKFGDSFSFGRYQEKSGRLEQHIKIFIENECALDQQFIIDSDFDWNNMFLLQGSRNFTSIIYFNQEPEDIEGYSNFVLESGLVVSQSFNPPHFS